MVLKRIPNEILSFNKEEEEFYEASFVSVVVPNMSRFSGISYVQ
jgi:hypothetical protein